jgi:hypothetical protein
MRALYDDRVTVAFRRGLYPPEVRSNRGGGDLRDPGHRQGEGGCGFIVSDQGSPNAIEHPDTLHHEHVQGHGSLLLPVKQGRGNKADANPTVLVMDGKFCMHSGGQ